MTKPKPKTGLLATRPAETASAGTGAAGVIVAIAAGNELAAVLALIGFLPAVVTYLNTHGGIKGVLGTLWGGKK